MHYFDQINGHKCLYLDHVGEPEDNSLLLRIDEARSEGPEIDVEIVEGKSLKGRAIETTIDCSRYSVYFEGYIAYAIVNESYAQTGKNELYEGDLARVYSRSHFLDFVSKTTFASSDYPGPFTHYAFMCLNHCVDVVSCIPPKIEQYLATKPSSHGTNFVR